MIGGDAFRSCKSLRKINIPDTVTRIGQGAFYDCSSLERIVIPDGVVKLFRDTFRNCSALAEIRLSSKLELIGDSCFSDCISLKRIVLPDTIRCIDGYAFFDVVPDEPIIIPAGVEYLSDDCFVGLDRKYLRISPAISHTIIPENRVITPARRYLQILKSKKSSCIPASDWPDFFLSEKCPAGLRAKFRRMIVEKKIANPKNSFAILQSCDFGGDAEVIASLMEMCSGLDEDSLF